MKARFLLNERSLSLHSHTSVWLWLTSVLALGFVLGICVCAAAVPGERRSDDGESKKAVFAPSVKSTQIGLLDEWTCLCPFHAGCPFVMLPLLREQWWGCNYCQNHHDCDEEAWNKRIDLLSRISSTSLGLNNLYYRMSLTRGLRCPHKNAKKARLTF